MTRKPVVKRPSEVFAERLKETREARSFSQTELAQRVTEAGVPMSKAALLRIEKGTRGLLLDEALALAHVLYVAPAHLLSPPDDGRVALTPNFAVDGAAMRNWLLFADPLLLTAPGRRVRARTELASKIENYVQAFVDAKRGRDTEGQAQATKAIEAAIQEHQKEMARVNAEDEGNEQ